MNQYNCLIVDDEPIACEIILHYCSQLTSLNVIGVCENAINAKNFLTNNNVNIIFLDIQMPVLDGLSFLKTLKQPPQIIFTTAYKEYAIDAFDLRACDYLLKPFSLERFIIAVDKAVEKLNTNTNKALLIQPVANDYFFIKAEGKTFKINYEDLFFAEAKGNYTRIVSANKVFISAISFTNFEKLLPSEVFIRVHRSYIINKSKLESIEGNAIWINNTEIPIGSNYKEYFFKSLGL